MIYKNMIPAKFISRPNRFVANIEIGGRAEICHVKNTGRCRELLVPGADIFVQEADSPNRKTKYSLISVYKGDTLINMDSQAPNQAVVEWLAGGGLMEGITRIKPECKYGNSRFDVYVEAGERKAYIEVKGVTLEEGGVALFPDAPTERGVKHIRELCDALADGYGAYAIFVIQMKGVRLFKPNARTHQAFADALREAAEQGVRVLAYSCQVDECSIKIDKPVEVDLGC